MSDCFCPSPEVEGNRCAKCGGINPKVDEKKTKKKKEKENE